MAILTSLEAWYNKGLALNKLGHTTEADAAFAKAKEMGDTCGIRQIFNIGSITFGRLYLLEIS